MGFAFVMLADPNASDAVPLATVLIGRQMAAAFWSWFKEKVSITAMLREQLALCGQRVSDLESKNGELQTQVAVREGELETLRTAYHQTEDELAKLKKEYAEDVVVNSGVEFRRGKRTLGQWLSFCPKCHIALHPWRELALEKLSCSANCGWISPVDDSVIRGFLSSGNVGK